MGAMKVVILIDEKALATKPLVILDVRPEKQFAKEHIIGAEHSQILISCEHYETEPMRVRLTVCGHVYGADEVVSTFCDMGHNVMLLREGTVSEAFFGTAKAPYPEELLTTTNGKPVKLEPSKLAVQLAVNRKSTFEKSPLHQTFPFSQL
ncbi:unnamed protein product [Wuchereria bancrofti]|uniref:Rhodanese domain-containing protein n=1 Tax=Wuchereria bancrofti TaxID=6293 RepID=A0A3P7E4H5_WUCBA|nr:unnamed protein product [Wuchereria bancrofti]